MERVRLNLNGTRHGHAGEAPEERVKIERYRPGAQLNGTSGRPPLVVELEHAIVLQLRPAAARRGLSVSTLAREILDVVATERLVDAVLDDGTSIPVCKE
jgi:hypothetical protein